MAFGNGHDLYVTSQGTGQVLQFNWQTGQYLGVFASIPNGPSGLLFDKNSNNLFVSEFGQMNGELIDRFNTAPGPNYGQLLGQFGAGTGPTGRTDMAIGPDGLLYVNAFFFDNRILRFDPATGARPAPPRAIPRQHLPVPIRFTAGSGLAFDQSGKLDAVGMFTSNVCQFASNGAYIQDLIPAPGGGLYWPSDILVDPDGNLLVSNMGDDKVQPQVNGYIGKFNAATGAAINPGFITFGGTGLTEPTAMLIKPYAVWSGGVSGDTHWKTAGNWRSDLPAERMVLRFGATDPGGHVENNNDFDPATEFYGITFSSEAPAYQLQGNAVKLGGPVNNDSAHNQAIDLDYGTGFWRGIIRHRQSKHHPWRQY